MKHASKGNKQIENTYKFVQNRFNIKQKQMKLVFTIIVFLFTFVLTLG